MTLPFHARYAPALIDRIGIFVAAACGLHCVCFPILLAIAAATNFVQVISRPVEMGLLAAAIVIGVVNLGCSWWRSHHRPECLILFAAGIVMIAMHDQIS